MFRGEGYKGGDRRGGRITIAKLKDSFDGEEQPMLCQSEMAEPVRPTMMTAKRIWMKRRPQR
jgi:hypothetical protein